jgi:hypothetical protein
MVLTFRGNPREIEAIGQTQDLSTIPDGVMLDHVTIEHALKRAVPCY